MKKTGVIISSWDDLRKDKDALKAFIDRFADQSVIILSQAETRSIPVIFRDAVKKSYVTDTRTLSITRLVCLCDEVVTADGKPVAIQKSQTPAKTKLGFIVSNGFGLGHVNRMQAFAKGLQNFAPISFMSFSAGLRGQDVFYLPSAQYLKLDDFDGDIYTTEAIRRFLNTENPTHVFYDGNVLPSGLLRALKDRPEIHLTWIRRAMWQGNTAPQFMAQQAMVDLVIEPGDIAQSYDAGPSWQQRLDYCPPCAFLQTPAVKPKTATLNRDPALQALKLDAGKRYALLMLGATQKADDRDITLQAVKAVQKAGLVPVIAHWPISHDLPPKIDGAIVIEQMPIAAYYKGFDVLVSAAGYNSFHEVLASGIKTVFVPQEDAGRDNQLARAQYAADHGHAVICRRTDLDTLDTIIQSALSETIKPIGERKWLEDWSCVFQAIGGNINKKKKSSVKFAVTAPKKLIKAAFKHWKSKNKPYAARFILALDMDYDAFSRKIKSSNLKTIIITNSVDPIALRRGGYDYVWLNDTTLVSRHTLFRQILNWLHVWRPQEMITL